nr:MAG TPA: hypothetical protein [Caudoviricetes sp.]
MASLTPLSLAWLGESVDSGVSICSGLLPSPQFVDREEKSVSAWRAFSAFFAFLLFCSRSCCLLRRSFAIPKAAAVIMAPTMTPLRSYLGAASETASRLIVSSNAPTPPAALACVVNS